AVDRLEPIQVDRTTGPLTLGAEVAPGRDLLVAKPARLRVDRIQLREAQAIDRVVLVDQDHARCGLPQRADASRRHFDREWLVAVLVDKRFLLGRKHFASDRSQIALARDKSRRAG